MGRAGVRAALAGNRAKMVSLRPLDARDEDTCDLVALATVAGGDRRVPAEWQGDSHTGVTTDFVRYVRPIVGGLVDYPAPLKDPLSPPSSLQRQSA